MKYLLILLLAGCTTIHTYVPGWPQNVAVIHRVVEPGEVMDACYKYLTTLDKLMLAFPLACAEIDLDKNTCTITRQQDASAFVIAHEEEHCKGGDHDDILQNYFNEWTAAKG